MKRLLLHTAFIEANRFLWHNRADFMNLAYLPVVALTILTTILFAAYPEMTLALPDPEAEAAATGVFRHPAWLVLAVVGLALYVPFVVAWTRAYLVPGADKTIGEALKWRTRQTRFLIRQIALIVALNVIMNILQFGSRQLTGEQTVSGPATIVLLFLYIYAFLVFARLRLWLAAGTVDHPLSISECLRVSRGYGGALLILIFVPGVPALLAILLPTVIAGSILEAAGLGQSIISMFVINFCTVLAAFAMAAATSTAFAIAFETLAAPPATAKTT